MVSRFGNKLSPASTSVGAGLFGGGEAKGYSKSSPDTTRFEWGFSPRIIENRLAFSPASPKGHGKPGGYNIQIVSFASTWGCI